METSIGCSVVLHDRLGHVLIAQRSAIKKQFPLRWETIGGALEPGESPEECVRRETLEEIGCAIADLQLFQVNVHDDEIRYVGIVYTGRIEKEPEPNIEIAQVRWVTESELNAFSFFPGCREKCVAYFRQVNTAQK